MEMTLGKTVALGATAFFGLVGLLRSFTVVPAGHVTVLDTFGSVNKQEVQSGIHWPVNPLSQRIQMETRTKEVKEAMQVPTKEGLIATLDVSILYSINPEKADEIYSTLGTNYSDVVIVPTLRNITRDVIANYLSEDLYNQNRGKIGSDMDKQLTLAYEERGINLENVLLRDLALPKEVTSAIERKIKAKQEAEQMQYVLQKETQEAERKIIEAGGISAAQKVIAGTLSKEYLMWKYVESLESLAQSNNTTFVIAPYDDKIVPMLPLQEAIKPK